MKQYTPQEIVDTVIPLMVEQGCPSIDRRRACVYREPNGTKCAAGFFITDEEAECCKPVREHPAFQGQTGETRAVLQKVQSIAHDLNACLKDGFIPAFLSSMKTICQDHNLKFPEEYAQWK